MSIMCISVYDDNQMFCINSFSACGEVACHKGTGFDEFLDCRESFRGMITRVRSVHVSNGVLVIDVDTC